ncbi:MAG: AI-2E family transporter [Gaiellaceae bacterium]
MSIPTLRHEDEAGLQETAKKTAIVVLVAVGIVALALALWKVRIVLALLFGAWMVAAAMRPGVERLARRGIPRGIGVLLHYAALAGTIAILLAFVVPQATPQVGQALGQVPTSSEQVGRAARESSGVKRQVLLALQKRLQRLPSPSNLVHPAIAAGKKALEVLVEVFFVLASAAYWVFERDEAIDLVASLVPRPKRRTVRQTWKLIDLKLGAFVRGELLLVALVAIVLSFAFWLDGLPYWLLLGICAGLFEIVPVVGPLIVAVMVVGAGLTVSWPVAAGALIAVVVVRQIQDYLVNPRVLGGVVGLSPLLVLVAVAMIGILLGPFYVLIATPLAAALATLVEVIVLGRDPEEAKVPTVIFSASDSEA